MTITFRSPIKPHYSLKEIQSMANEITEAKPQSVSEYLRQQSTGASFGNIDASDLKPPRLKVLAGQSPEVLDGTPGARPGKCWVTIQNQNLGPRVVGSPSLQRKSYQEILGTENSGQRAKRAARYGKRRDSLGRPEPDFPDQVSRQSEDLRLEARQDRHRDRRA